MATSLNSSQIRDGTVSRVDLNTTTIGQSVISKIVQGTYMSITSTGSDSGTGDVTLNVNVPLATTTVAGLLSPADKTTLSNFAGAGYAPLNSPSFVGYPVSTLNILTLGNTSFSQIIQNPATFTNDTGSFATSVVILSLPNSYVAVTNTQMFIEVSGKDAVTGLFRLLITAKLTNDGGTATSWSVPSATVLAGSPTFTTLGFAMSVAAPKLPIITFGDGSGTLGFPTYTVEKVTILGPTANTLYNAGSVMTLSMISQASIATTYVVQTTVPVNTIARLNLTSTQTFSGAITVPSLTANTLVNADTVNATSSLISRGNFYFPHTVAGGTVYSGLVMEVQGDDTLLNYGVNFDQLGINTTSVPSMFGAYFRIDTRLVLASEMFSVSAIPTGTGTSISREQKIFRLNRAGDIFSTVNGYAVATSNNFATVIPVVTITVAGLMSAADKVTFNSIPTTYASATNFATVIPAATISVSGLLTGPDKNKLDTIVNNAADCYGNQFDSTGTIIYDGTTTVLGVTASASSYALNGDVQVLNMTINAGVTIKTNGYRIICEGTLTNNGTITRTGTSATGASATSAVSAGTVSGLIASPAGVAGALVGANSAANLNSLGNAGGSGGISGAGQAGGVSSYTPPPISVGGIGYFISLPGMMLMTSVFLAVLTQAKGGNPGASGGAAATSTSGAGGGGGGIIVIAARFITGTGTITAVGGNGGNATLGNAGGGGGGAGGCIVIATSTNSRFISKQVNATTTIGGVTLNVSGGIGGTGIGTGTAGQAGGIGVISVDIA